MGKQAFFGSRNGKYKDGTIPQGKANRHRIGADVIGRKRMTKAKKKTSGHQERDSEGRWNSLLSGRAKIQALYFRIGVNIGL